MLETGPVRVQTVAELHSYYNLCHELYNYYQCNSATVCNLTVPVSSIDEGGGWCQWSMLSHLLFNWNYHTTKWVHICMYVWNVCKFVCMYVCMHL